jgi:citrate lyase beta subunit
MAVEAHDLEPVHVVYGGAHLFKAGTLARLGELARQAFAEHAATPADLGALFGLEPAIAALTHERVLAKLISQPVEDYRIDFEDGFGYRPEAEEQDAARVAGRALAARLSEGPLGSRIGIRLRRERPRTLGLFLETLLADGPGGLPAGFVVTLPKVTEAGQVAALAASLAHAEIRHGLTEGAIGIEIMVETPGSIYGEDGRLVLRDLVAAAGGRCRAAHFGAYDYTAALGVTASEQALDHPACDLARGLLQIGLAGTGVRLSDGATIRMPVGERSVVHEAWRASYAQIRRALKQGYYQGWDLHPAQIPVRYAATYAFFLEARASASLRLKNFLEQAAQATRVGSLFDDAASGQGLLNFFLRGLDCGALTEADCAAAGIAPAELRTRSFDRILETRAAT